MIVSFCAGEDVEEVRRLGDRRVVGRNQRIAGGLQRVVHGLFEAGLDALLRVQRGLGRVDRGLVGAGLGGFERFRRCLDGSGIGRGVEGRDHRIADLDLGDAAGRSRRPWS